MRKLLGFLGIIITISASDVLGAGRRDNNNKPIVFNKNNLYIRDIESKKLEGIDGNIAESVIDKCGYIYFVALTGEEDLLMLYKYDGNVKISIDNEKRSFSNVIADSNCNIYFTSCLQTQPGLHELFVIKQGTTTPSKINGINHDVDVIYVDDENNVYIGTSQYGSYMINNGETSAKKIEYLNKMADDNLFFVDKNNTVYFVNRVLPNDEICYLTKEEILKPNPTVKTISGITSSTAKSVNIMLSDKNNNIYIGTSGGLFKINANDQQVTTILTDAVGHAVIDKQNNIYYASYYPSYSAYITTNSGVTENIKNLESLGYIITDIQIDSDDTVYFVVMNIGIYILKYGDTTPTNMNGISSDVYVKKLKIDEINNAYIITRDRYLRDSIHVLEKYNDFPKRISGIQSFFKTIVFDNSNYAYIGTGEGVYLVSLDK